MNLRDLNEFEMVALGVVAVVLLAIVYTGLASWWGCGGMGQC